MARDYRSAWGPYSLWAEVGLDCQTSQDRRDAPERRQARPLQDAQWMAARPCEGPAALQKAVPQAMQDELVLPPGKTALRQASPPPVPQAQ